MCEFFAYGGTTPTRLADLLPWARGMEKWGICGFGWGVAWLDAEAKVVRGFRSGRSLREDVDDIRRFQNVTSTRFLVHLRRPSKLSTLGTADSQPFTREDGGFAFCHNGYFELADEQRGEYEGRLAGVADSEVGFRLLEDLLARGITAEPALPLVHQQLGGQANLGFLAADGTLLVYSALAFNPVWSCSAGTAQLATTSLSSLDESVFELVYGDKVSCTRLREGIVTVAGPVHSLSAA